MAHVYKGLIASGNLVLGQVETGYDEWGNLLETASYYGTGNAVTQIAESISPLAAMANDRNILSRSVNFDVDSGIATLTETRVLVYANPDIKRVSLESQSGREPITAHPNFEEIAGTPDEPNFANAVWVKADDADETMRFVELRGAFAGYEQFISGSGTLLRVQWIDAYSNVGFDDKLGKIEYPEGTGIWGGASSWLLVGATSEPFGSQAKHTKIYRLASSNASRTGGWMPYFYA
jgi:hypothetical protein